MIYNNIITGYDLNSKVTSYMLMEFLERQQKRLYKNSIMLGDIVVNNVIKQKLQISREIIFYGEL